MSMNEMQQKKMSGASLQLSVIQQVSEEISGLLDIQEICEKVQSHMLADLGFDISSVTLLDEATREIKVVSSKTPYKLTTMVEKFAGIKLGNFSLSIDHPDNVSAKAIRENKIQYSDRLSDVLVPIVSKNNCDILQSLFGMKTFIVVPIRSNNKVIGGLSATSRGEIANVASPNQLIMLQALANALGNAINYARVHKDSEEKIKNHLLAFQQVAGEISKITDLDELIQQVPLHIARLVGIKTTSLFFYNKPKESLELRATNNDIRGSRAIKKILGKEVTEIAFDVEASKSLLVKSFLEKRIYHTQDFGDLAHGAAPRSVAKIFQKLINCESVACIPMIFRDECFGIITVGLHELYLTEFDKQVYQTFANQVALAIHNAQIFQQTKNELTSAEQKSAELKSILETTGVINQTYDIEKVFNQATVSMKHHFGYDISGLLLIKENYLHLVNLNASEKHKNIFDKALGFPMLGVKFDMRDSNNLLVKTAQEKKIFVSDDMYDAAQPILNKTMTRAAQNILGVKTVVGIPLIIKNDAIGIISVSKLTKGTTQQELDTLQTFANQIAIAIENARLYESLQNTIFELKKLNEIQMQFLADTSHELKTPIAAIQGNAEIISYVAPTLAEEKSEEIKIIKDSAVRMNKVVAQLLTLTRHDTGHLGLVKKETNLKKLVAREILNLKVLATKKQIDMKVEINDNVVFALDEDRFAEVVQNLLSNAIKYTPKMGTISIQGVKDEQGLRISIKDSGVGIPEKDIPYIFDRFFKVDKKRDRELGGTGLGLAICKSIVEAHGGTIEVASELGKGAQFNIQIPN